MSALPPVTYVPNDRRFSAPLPRVQPVETVEVQPRIETPIRNTSIMK